MLTNNCKTPSTPNHNALFFDHYKIKREYKEYPFWAPTKEMVANTI